MPEAWINFGILLFVQLLIFFVFALYEKKLSNVWQVLAKGIPIGIPFGLSFDLVLGKYLGLSTYALGFDMSFLILNAVLSYGIFAATILLLRRQPLHFCVATLFITALYEFVNLFLHVWKWQFPVPIVLFPILLGIGYMVGAILVVGVERLFRPKKF
ncbi:MAG: hypothetical protein JWM39_742 [Parcubacteria group bacterium]|nr:hypothetical protein [Parcubacteria group bacterium]